MRRTEAAQPFRAHEHLQGAVGIIAFGESASALRIASAALIVAGIVGLKLAAK